MKVYEVKFFGSKQSFSQGVFLTLARAQEELENNKAKILFNNLPVFDVTEKSFSYTIGWEERLCKYAIQEIDVIE